VAKTAKVTKPVEVGSHVEAMCGKCKEATSHVVLAMTGGKPSRVECRACHAHHAYRAPGGGGSATRPTRKRGTAPAATRSAEEIWASAMRQATATALTYTMSERFDPGQRLKHPTFGEGVVTKLLSPTVCEVTFRDGVRKLLMGH
jgi:hypothetical protein